MDALISQIDYHPQFDWDPAWDTILDDHAPALLAAAPPLKDRTPDAPALLAATPPLPDAPARCAATPPLKDRAPDAPALLAATPPPKDRAPDAPTLLAATPPMSDHAPDAPTLLATMPPPPPPPRRLWADAEVEFLLDQTGATIELVDSLEEEQYVPPSYFWSEIASKMQAQGYHRSRDDCRYKYRKLLRSYKKRRGKNSKCYDALLEAHVRREEAKPAAEAKAAASSSAAARARARAAERRRRRRALSGQGGAGGAPAVEGGDDALKGFLLQELDKREERILDTVRNVLLAAGVPPLAIAGSRHPDSATGS